LKIAVSSAPSLHPINYSTDLPVILSVDTSYIAIGFILSQYDESGHKRPARYGSLPINECESRYSQPKLELYGLFCALHHYRLFLYGVKNVHVEVDAKYIKGMLNNPYLQPNATINRWIEGILLFDFKLIHIPAARHQGPDVLSRHQPTEEEIEDGKRDAEDADEWLEDLLFCTAAHPLSYAPITLPSFLSQDTTQDVILRQILHFLQTTQLPSFPSNTACKLFIRRCRDARVSRCTYTDQCSPELVRATQHSHLHPTRTRPLRCAAWYTRSRISSYSLPLPASVVITRNSFGSVWTSLHY